MAERTRPRITVTVDPGMLEEVDSYVREHEGTDRSQVIDEALRCWYAAVLHEALVKQHSASRTTEELVERAAWKRIRSAQLPRLLRKHQQREA